MIENIFLITISCFSKWTACIKIWRTYCRYSCFKWMRTSEATIERIVRAYFNNSPDILPTHRTKKDLCFWIHSQNSIIDCFKQTSWRRLQTVSNERYTSIVLQNHVRYGLYQSALDPRGSFPTRCLFGMHAEMRFNLDCRKKLSFVRFWVLCSFASTSGKRVCFIYYIIYYNDTWTITSNFCY